MLSGKMAVDAGELQYARLKIQVLEERLRKMRIAKYGPGSESQQPGSNCRERTRSAARVF
jgi:hypothetical protein